MNEKNYKGKKIIGKSKEKIIEDIDLFSLSEHVVGKSQDQSSST